MRIKTFAQLAVRETKRLGRRDKITSNKKTKLLREKFNQHAYIGDTYIYNGMKGFLAKYSHWEFGILLCGGSFLKRKYNQVSWQVSKLIDKENTAPLLVDMELVSCRCVLVEVELFINLPMLNIGMTGYTMNNQFFEGGIQEG